MRISVPHAAFTDVFQIQRQPLIKGQLVAPGRRLPVTGQPGSNRQTPHLLRRILLHLAGKRRPGAHQAHIPPDHIDQLGQLVQAGFPDEFPHAGDPRVVLDLKGRVLPSRCGPSAAPTALPHW